jgi:transposase
LLLRIHLAQAHAIDAAIAQIDAELGDRLEPFREATLRLTTIPGVSDITAAVIVAEIGVDMTRFPRAAHLISWAGLGPRNEKSAGKRRSTTLRTGAPWLKTLLVQVAWAASRKKRSYFRALFTRLTARRGSRKAIVAGAAATLTTVYWLLKRGVLYTDLGADHFPRTERTRLAARLTPKLAELGFRLTLPIRPRRDRFILVQMSV